MRVLIFTLILFSVPASAMERDENSKWVKEWNTLASSIEEKEAIARKMELNNYVRYRREIVGLIDKNASSTPVNSLEREMVYFLLGAYYMDKWQRYSVLPMNTVDRELLMGEIPKFREKANIYMRKLMEIPDLHMMSRLLIARIQELNGFRYASDIEAKIPSGAKFWEFILNPSTRDNVYFLHDFKEEYADRAVEKRGGRLIQGRRTVCAGLLVCLYGTRFDDELVIRELNSVVGVRVTVTVNKTVEKVLPQKFAFNREDLFTVEGRKRFNRITNAPPERVVEEVEEEVYLKIDGWREL